ncbi:AAA family ATPase [Methanobrevibacter sp.]|uniref:AAA family ATPase n=1 Tax=Methanobrevibacter sp. TaxID=66852 RepID=UPI003869725E
MLTLTDSSNLAFELASTEAMLSKHEFITEDFLFIGVFSLDKAIKLMENKSSEKVQKDSDSIKKDYEEINEIIKRFDLDFETIRTELKIIVGNGDFKLNRTIIHRDQNCKMVCEKANEIALKEYSTIRPIHILKALLINPTINIKTLFSKLDVDITQFKNSFITIEKVKVKPQVYDSPNTVLGKYGTNLTQLAKDGELNPVIGREKELLQLVRTLSKRKKNNPLIIGEAGVGKTALVNALAINIAEGNVNEHLKNKVIIEVSVASLVSGTQYRGDFEDKLTQLLQETKDNPDVILFIDEIHTILGAGGVGDGGLDASNILKPALANGDLSLIGATTIKEYRRYFERDAAFERRFQPILVEEPSAEDTIIIINGLKENYEEYHGVKISNEAIEDTVYLSIRYMPDRNLPDKALDVIDEACSRKLVPDLHIHSSTENNIVTSGDVKNIITDLTGIPVTEESADLKKLKDIDSFLKSKIVGQNDAIETVSRRVKMSSIGIQNHEKPLGVFLFLGPTGVGKTYLSKLLAEFLFGDKDFIIRVDMSEYMESQSVSRLVGAAPGLVGYDDGGYLTDAIRNNPYSIVLIDEIEKAHPQVMDLFLQLFDEGRLTDSKGNTVNARNCIFIMTSNLTINNFYQTSSSDIDVMYGGVTNKSIPKMDKATQMELLTQHFRPEFVNRIDEVVQFRELDENDFESLVNLCIDDISKRVLSDKNIKIKYDDNVSKYLASQGFNKNFGARYLNRSVEEQIEYPIADLIINEELKNGDTLRISASKKGLEFMPIKE